MRILVAALMLFLAGCAAGPFTEPAPVFESRESGAGRLPPDPALNGAARALLEQAAEAQGAGQAEAAIGLLERALRLAPRSALVHLRLAALHWQQGERNEARQFWQRGRSLAATSALRGLFDQRRAEWGF